MLAIVCDACGRTVRGFTLEERLATFSLDARSSYLRLGEAEVAVDVCDAGCLADWLREREGE